MLQLMWCRICGNQRSDSVVVRCSVASHIYACSQGVVLGSAAVSGVTMLSFTAVSPRMYVRAANVEEWDTMRLLQFWVCAVHTLITACLAMAHEMFIITEHFLVRTRVC